MKVADITYDSLDNKGVFKLIDTTREGVNYSTFEEFSLSYPLSSSDWSRILNMSERTMQRYRKEKV
ncbi:MULTISPECIES: antitoxin Xre-like helix-turn-helix domain-containing protein [unclassified Saccharicrinis]|uniref:antitoxin Xre-like helix-turn-helix domain-containing protein n=1 Tax=unclassified Saccharicrinis TaxID=2646859 RepID=UPI003D340BD6